MKVLKKLLVVTLIIGLLIPAAAMAAAAPGISILINGKDVDLGQDPISVDGRVFVPFRGLFEYLGASVKWNSKSQTVTATREKVSIYLKLNDNFAYVNNERISLDSPSRLVNGKVYVPVRFVTQAFGDKVSWDSKTKTVKIEDEWLKRQTSTPGTDIGLENLYYYILYNQGKPGRLGLAVVNSSNKNVKVTVPSGKLYDFTLSRWGYELWRFSRDNDYTNAINTTTFAPWETKIFWADLPYVGGGDYQVKAYFANYDKPVASTQIYISGFNGGYYYRPSMQYGLNFKPGNVYMGNDDQMLFTVKNPAQLRVDQFNMAYEITIWGSNGFAWSKIVPGLYESIGAGSTQYHFVKIPRLTTGYYYAEVKAIENGYDLGVVAKTSFSVWDAQNR